MDHSSVFKKMILSNFLSDAMTVKLAVVCARELFRDKFNVYDEQQLLYAGARS